MADDVVIGSASVQIVGDYSGLAKSFQESQSLAQSAGQQISTSLESGAAGANNLTSAINGTADALTGIITPTADAEAKLQELFAQGMSVSEAMAALGAQTSQAASTEEQLGAASGQAAAGVASVGQAAQQATPALQEASQASNSLLDSLMQFAATAITAAAIQRIGEESIMAYGRLQQLTTSLNLMGAGAAGAAEKVDELKALSIQLAIPFENLAHQAQGLAAQFGTGEGMTAVLIAAANAAGGAGKSFDAASAAIERIGVTGAVSARQLFALGLNWEDMAKSMSVSIADAQEKLKKGGQDAQQDVSDVIDAINTKFHDAAEMQAQNTLGVWTNLKNQAEFIFQSIGEDLAPIVDVFSGVMKVLASGFELFVGGIKLAVDAVIGLVLEGMASLRGLGQVAADVAAGNFVKAVTDAGFATQAIRNAAERTNTELLSDSLKTAAKLESIWSDSAKKISASFTPKSSGGDADSSLQASRDKVKGFSDQNGALALLVAMERQEIAAQKEVTAETAKFNEATGAMVSQSEYLAIKVAAASESVRNFGAIELPKAKDGTSALEKETNKLYGTMKLLAEGVSEAGQQALDTTSWGKMDAALKMLGLSADDLGMKTRAAKVAAAEYVAANNLEMPNVTASWQTINSEINRLSKVNLPAAIAMQKELVASMIRVQAPLGQIYDAQEKELQLEIEMNSERGDFATKQILALEMMRIKNDALRGSTEVLSTFVKQLHNDYDQLFEGFSAGVAHSILKGGEFWHFWHDIWQKFEQDVMTHVVEGALKAMADALIRNIGLGKVLDGIFSKIGLGGAAGGGLVGTGPIGGGIAGGLDSAIGGGASAAGGGAASGAGGAASAASSGVAGIVSAVSGVVSAVSSIVGNFQMAGMNKTLDLIENYTRYLKIGLVEQGDSLLNDQHVIRNTLTDMMKFNWDVQATYFQGISEKLDTLIGMGGVHSPVAAKAVSSFSTAAATGSDAGTTVNVNIDRVEAGVSDAKVRDTFNRGFRLSKLAGALPPGRFPQ